MQSGFAVLILSTVSLCGGNSHLRRCSLNTLSLCGADSHLPRNIRPVNCRSSRGLDLCINSRCTTVAPPNITACLCNQGTIPNTYSPLECVDLDECRYYDDVCRVGTYGRCVNEVGDYRCECDSRYYRTAADGHYCQAIQPSYQGLPYWLYTMLYSMNRNSNWMGAGDSTENTSS